MNNKQLAAKAFTLIELVIVVVIIGIVMLALAFRASQRDSECGCAVQRISCVNNLKQIGTAYRIWSGDNAGRVPQESSIHIGGWSEYLAATNAGRFCWTNYVIMQNELGQSPRVLLCPADTRKPANNFKAFGNQNISYFVGAGARDYFPDSIMSGDRNIAPGNKPKKDFGFSKADDIGNDVMISTNSNVDPICWSSKMHSDGNTDGGGNILLGDGSVNQCTTVLLQTKSQAHALDVGNFPLGYVSKSNSFRLIFP